MVFFSGFIPTKYAAGMYHLCFYPVFLLSDLGIG